VSDDELLSIGVFALVSGLSINALRHYDEVGLLRPAYVDPVTGYRRYRPDQLHQARLICALRRVDLPVEAVREVLDDERALRPVLGRHRQQLVDRADALSRMVGAVDHYIENGVTVPELKTPRIVQVTIDVTDLAGSIAFYRAAFDATFNEEISSFQFGTWPSDEFFLLTVATQDDRPHGRSRFGLLVDDVDAVHRRALGAGATEVHPPVDKPWKPRSSCVADPSGNRIDLYQG
jgi:DNA-binding transcriptional MerR regulator/predicted enzyme related to lactoylglutathione lyase